MKNKIIIAIFTMAFLLSFLISTTKIEATTLNDLSYAKGENLIDNNNLEYDGAEVKSINNIYLKETCEIITFQIEEYFCNNVPMFYVEFFDIDFYSLGSELYNSSTNFVTHNNKSWGVGYIDSSDYPDAFSFSISCYPIEDGVEIEDLELMCFLGEDLKDSYIPFVEADGLIDIVYVHPTINVSYDAPLDINDLKEIIKAKDGYDGYITNNIVIDANSYLESSNVKGLYTINVTVTDSSSNIQTGYFYINVVDNDKPSITGPTHLDYPINSEITDSILLSNFSAYDNYDKDVSSNLSVITDYTSSSAIIKTENVEIQAIDGSGNIETFTFELRFYDNIPPVITAPEVIEYGYQVVVSASDILNNNVIAQDNIDLNDVIITMTENDYTGNENVIGEYIIEVTATDKSGNSSKKEISIIITDEIKPVIFIDTYIIEITESVSLKRVDFDNLLYASKVIDKNHNYNVTILKDTYTGHETEKGSYLYSLKYVDENGDELTKTFKINVGNTSYKIVSAVEIEQDKNYILIWIFIVSVLILGLISSLLVLKHKEKSK